MIAVENLTCTSGGFRLEGVSFSVGSGEYAVLMGPTGAGKTTLLETICGVRPALSGSIRLGERDVTHSPPAERGIGYVPQEAALFPRMTVVENLGFALRMRGVRRGERMDRCTEIAESLGIAYLLKRKAAGLSGGEAQRVALGRALAPRPGVLIFDEPLSGLDDAKRHQMLQLLIEVRQSSPVTTLHVTHNRDEADSLAQRLLLIEGGKLVSPAAERCVADHSNRLRQNETGAPQP